MAGIPVLFYKYIWIDLFASTGERANTLPKSWTQSKIFVYFPDFSRLSGVAFDSEKSVEITGSPFHQTLESQLLSLSINLPIHYNESYPNSSIHFS
jgi:hypothetical protein